MNHYDIFISYSRKDAPIVEDVVSTLEQQGFRIWLDKNGVESGDAFKRIIVKAIEESTCVLFFSSVNSNLSKWTAKEIGVAVYENKIVIPVLIDNSKYNPEVKFDLINLDYIDFTNPISRPEMLTKLIKTLSVKCDKAKDDIRPIPDGTCGTKSNCSFWQRLQTKYWNPFLGDLKERNALVNFVLLAIQVLGIISIIPGISGTLWSFSLLDSPEWSFSKIYGKGFVPGFLMSVVIVISNALTLRWNKNGVYLLFVSFVLIFIPTIWNEFEEFIYFSLFSILGLFIYWGILKIPYKGLSTWGRCKANTNTLKYLSITAIAVWVATLSFFPPLIAKATGFTNDLYNNGIIAIDARCHGGAFYLRRLANKMAYGQMKNRNKADEWYRKAIYESERDFSDDRGIFSKDCYVDYIFYLAKSNRKMDAIEYLKKALEKFGLEELQEEIEDDSYEYDRNPYRSSVLHFLSSAKE